MGQFFSSSNPSPPTPARLPGKAEAASSSETFSDHQPKTTPDGLSVLARAKGHYWYPNDGPKILDACGGAGVACIGHGRNEVVKAATAQMKLCSYASYAHFKTSPVQELSDWLIASTGGEMQKVYLMCSGKHG